MVDVFISYSRKDKEFVTRLHNALAALDRDTWVDWEDIPATADWWREVQGGIESSDSFVFIISPDSIKSDVCRQEIEHAIANNKRFVPILHRPVTDPADQKLMHPAISTHNWLFFREGDDFNKAFKTLMDALDTDLSHVREHTRLLVRAREWDTGQRNRGFLLHGDDLKKAEMWLAEGVAKKPAPIPLHAEYIGASRQAETARQRRLLAGVSLALVVSVALAILSLVLFGEATRQQGIAEQQAVRAENNAATAVSAQNQALAQATEVALERDRAQSIALAGQAQVELDGPLPDRAVLLALTTFQNFRYTWQAERALAFAMKDHLGQYTLTGHTAEVVSVDWFPRPGNQTLVTASNDGTARIWNVTGSLLFTIEAHPGGVNRALWSPDGKWIATGGDDFTARIWGITNNYGVITVAAGPVLSGHTGSVVNLAWSPDGTKLVTASSDDTARVWDTTTGQLLFTLAAHTGTVNNVVWSPDGTRIATSSDDNTAIIWNAATGEILLTLEGHRSAVSRVVWSPDGTRVATGSDDSTARIWNAIDGGDPLILTGHIRRITRLAWSPDGARIATASADQTARIWDTATGEMLRTLFGHTNDINGLAWSPGGSRLITVSEDGTARMWYTESGGELLSFTGHTGVVYSLAWSAGGEFFATTSSDGTARVWQIWRNAQNLVSLAKQCCAARILTDEENIQFGLATATVAPTPTPAPANCPDTTLPSRLYAGARGRVLTEGDPSPVMVRQGPGTGFDRVGRVSPGQTFQVVGGPECSQGITWFQITYGIGAVQGWLAEGVDGVYFVEPILSGY
ncbi:MAG: TIR domain-containing protein [Anaerolineae bacterium]|nr:TIR domain-containing protein [Anaerolineae bacterium]